KMTEFQKTGRTGRLSVMEYWEGFTKLLSMCRSRRVPSCEKFRIRTFIMGLNPIIVAKWSPRPNTMDGVVEK
ncbi:hypothetical protein KI387_031908, partial [Taxus chinensis]